ncbi:MAG: hypothetical protein ACOCWW_02430 [Bacteroidota bacterium]
MTSIDYSDITDMMQKGGAFQFYRAKTKASDPNRMQTLWKQIQLQRINSQINAKDCCFMIKFTENYPLTCDELMDISNLIQMEYSDGDIIWGCEHTFGDEIILEIIG